MLIAIVRGGARCASQVLGVLPRPLPAAPLVVRRRYLIEVLRLLPAEPLVARLPAAPRRYLTVAPRPLPAAPLVVRHRYMIVVPRPLPQRRDAVAAEEGQLGRYTAD